MSSEVRELGGVYTLIWEQEGIAVRLDKLIEDSKFSVTGEIQVRVAGRHIHQARMNLTSTRSRADVSRQCKSRNMAENLDWDSYIEEASMTVLERYRAGPEAIDFTDYVPSEKSSYLFYPFLLEGEANLFFGAGGSGKSYLASWLCAHISKGIIDPELIEGPKQKVLYLDYETGPEEIYNRLTDIQMGLGVDKKPEIIYHPSAHPLASEVEKIQRIVAEHQVALVVVDSVGYACGGEPETASNAINYYNALRQLHTTTLSIGHVAKDRNANSPFGSVYWVNGARSVWEVVRSQDSGANSFEIGVLHRKINNGPLAMPVGYKISFDVEAVFFEDADVKLIEEVESKLPLKDQIGNLISEHGHLEVKDIASMLEKNEGTIRKTLHRNVSLFEQAKNGAGPTAWSMKSVAVSDDISDLLDVSVK
tara:strand:+ start:4511 stop:5773 length:1263 start_codon:yes stop_codon:yes gene_type:complete